MFEKEMWGRVEERWVKINGGEGYVREYEIESL